MPRRADLLTHWFSRGIIGRDEFAAGQRFVGMYEAAALDGHATLDLSRGRVDGVRHEQAADRKVAARAALLAIRPRLGETDWGILCRIVGQGRSIEGSPEDQKYIRRRLRECLSHLLTLIAA